MEKSKEIDKILYDGALAKLHTCRVSKLPFNVWWLGQQRPLDQTEEAYFCSVYSKNTTTIEIEYKEKIDNIIIRPISKNVKYDIQGKVVKFTLDKFGQYVIENGDEHNALHLFFNEEKKFDVKDYNIVFDKGEYNVGKIVLKSGDKVYVGKDAVVNGCFYGENVKDVTISGYGIVCDKDEQRVSMHCYENYTNGCLKFYNSSSIKVEGIIFVDSAIWVVNSFDCENITLDNIKIVGHWRYNTDGIDIVNSRSITIKNSFIRSFDDAITLKGIIQHKDKDERNIFVDNCVCWCGWGRTLEIGLETVADNYDNITFRNCDLIHNSAVAMDIQAGDYADIDNLSFEDIRVEYQKNSLPEVINFPLDKKYDGYDKVFVPILISIVNEDYLINNEEYTWYDEKLKESRIGKKPKIKNVKFRNIKVFGETANNIMPKIVIKIKEPYSIENVDIKNVTMFGKRIENKEELNLEGNKMDVISYSK